MLKHVLYSVASSDADCAKLDGLNICCPLEIKPRDNMDLKPVPKYHFLKMYLILTFRTV